MEELFPSQSSAQASGTKVTGFHGPVYFLSAESDQCSKGGAIVSLAKSFIPVSPHEVT